MIYKRLGDLLLSVGLINEEQLNHALQLQKETKERLGTLLIDRGVITEKQLIEAPSDAAGDRVCGSVQD